MLALRFWKAVTSDESAVLDRMLDLLRRERVAYCAIGGVAVNAYAAPVVTLDPDLVVASDDLRRIEPLLKHEFQIDRDAHSLSLAAAGSDLRVQNQTDARFAVFVGKAQMRPVMGIDLPVARPEDLLQAKIWAVQDDARRASKRQEDLADIARLLEAFPVLRASVPKDVLQRLV